ncbi:hypothetical protein FB451DRAFT_1412199 [Mycena latifolia]|nr:hypothetical protein FB451DRAFT_1412199 [Mycena latifolia]
MTEGGGAPTTTEGIDAPTTTEGTEYIPPPRPAIVKRPKPAGHAKSKSKEDPTVKPGKTGWVWGTKLKFFSARKEEWVAAEEKGDPGDFYTKITRLYLMKYRYDLADDEDFETDVTDPPDSEATKVVNVRLSREEKALRDAVYKKVRGRLGQWYRGQFGDLVKEDKTAFTELFTEGAPGKPRRPQLLHFYSSRYYDSRVKDRFEARMRALEKHATHTGQPVPSNIKIQNEVTREVWDEEPEERQAETARGGGLTIKDRSLKTAAHYLQPFLDAIQERFGMCASLLLCGPVGTRGGRIEMQSVHTGKTKGLVQKDWPMYDSEGFRALEASMVDFAHHVFTREECDARKTGEQEVDMPDAPPAASTSGTTHPTPAPAGTARRTAAGTMGSTGMHAEVTRPAEENGGSGDSANEGGRGREGECEGEGGEDGEPDEVQAAVDRCWKRKDRAKWTDELVRAHRAFERGKEWGIECAGCVDKFFNFEAAFGYTDEGAQIGTRDRPGAMKLWITKARKWDATVDIGKVGAQGEEGTFADSWWKWWASLQPDEREMIGGMMTCPSGIDWGAITKLHGRNGMLQVIATLLWWGDEVAEGGNPVDTLRWSLAVGDVSWVLTEVLRPGVIKKKKRSTEKGTGEAGKKRKAAEDETGGESSKKRRKAVVDEGPRRGRSGIAARGGRPTKR